jgi:lipopolysaccharide assembly outer membrane protein LptD (OstA)
LKPLKSLFPLLLVSILFFWANTKAQAQQNSTTAKDTSITNQNGDSLLNIVQKNDSISITPKKQAIEIPIKYNAKDSIVYDIVNSKVYLYNKAEVYYGDISLKADYVVIDQVKKTVYAQGVKDSTGKVTGKPVFVDAGQTYNSEEMMYNFETKKGKIKEVTTQEGQGYLIANDVKKNEYNEVFIRNGKFTTCNLPHPHFYIALTKAKNIEDKTVSGPAYLVVEDVPLPLALPFGFFPRKSGRSSGILMPEIGEDRELGFFLRNGGYYLGINDYVDLALRADIYSRGSYGFNAFSRYNVKYKYNGSFASNYTDRRFGEPNTISFVRNQDFSIKWNHNQDPKAIPGTRFSALVNIATRNNYRNNITTNIQSITQNNLNSSISYSKNWEGTPFSLNGSMTHAQNLTNGSVSLGLPSVSFNMSRIFPFESKNRIGDQKWYHRIGVSYTADAVNKIETFDSLLFRKETLKDFQNGIIHRIPVSTSFNLFKYFTFSPFANYNERWYFSSVRKSWDGTQVITDTLEGFNRSMEYNGGLSLTTRIYGMYPVNKMGIVAVRHVVTPSVSYSYRPDFSRSSYGYYQRIQSDSAGNTSLYSIFENNNSLFGSPGGGKSSLLSYTFDNNIEMKIKKETDTGSVVRKIKIFESFRFTGNYNIAADSLKFSDINVVARTVLFEKINIDISAVYDLYTLRTDSLNRTFTVNEFEYTKNKRLARLTSASLSIGTSLNPDAFKSKAAQEQKALPKNKYDYAELEMINRAPQYYVDWTIPWNIAISYILSYQRPLLTSTTQQSVNFNGDISVTPKWKIGFTSGYDFTNKEITPTSLNIYRDLHCWDLSINWIPFGTFQRYSVDLKVKASILQDLKLSRRREFYERE